MARIIVIGGANVDIKGRPDAPLIAGTSNPGSVTVSAGGVGRNIAENLARLGEDVSLVAMVAEDGNGRLVRESCRLAGVDTSMLIACDAPTGVYLAVLDGAGEMVTAINDMRAAAAMTVANIESHADALARADILVADCNLPRDCLQYLCDFAAGLDARLVIEPISVPKARKLLDLKLHKPVHAVTPNRQQLEAMTGITGGEAGLRALHALGFANIAMHHGSAGVTVSDGAAVTHIPAFPSDGIADVTGAGDAAVAGLVCGLATGFDLVSSARLGQAAASLKLRSRKSVTDEMRRGRVFALAGLQT